MSLASIAHTAGQEGAMRVTIAVAVLVCASWLAGPAHAQPKATADIRDASGKSLGEAVLVQQDGAVQIDMTLTGLPKGVRAFHGWIRQSIADNKPVDRFVAEMISARGSTYDNAAANFYRANRSADVRAEAAAQAFLGTRMQCAKCHNHPFDRWTQHDYHSLAAFFVRVDYRIVENNRRDRLDKHEFDGEQIVYQLREGEGKHPRSGEKLQPRFLGGATPELSPGADRLQALADWIAAPDNALFSRAQANRVWYHLLGRGLVDPWPVASINTHHSALFPGCCKTQDVRPQQRVSGYSAYPIVTPRRRENSRTARDRRDRGPRETSARALVAASSPSSGQPRARDRAGRSRDCARNRSRRPPRCSAPSRIRAC